MDTIARGEMVESKLDAFIERRSRKGETDPDTEEALYMESVRRHHERVRRQNRALWLAYFCRQADSHRALSEHYEHRAEELCEEPNARSATRRMAQGEALKNKRIKGEGGWSANERMPRY